MPWRLRLAGGGEKKMHEGETEFFLTFDFDSGRVSGSVVYITFYFSMSHSIDLPDGSLVIWP